MSYNGNGETLHYGNDTHHCTTAMIHIISQINADPRKLQSPFTYYHNALHCTKKLT